MSAHQSAVVHVRGHEFTVYFVIDAGSVMPKITRLFLAGYIDDVLQIVSAEVQHLIRAEAMRKRREQEVYVARAIELERLES